MIRERDAGEEMGEEGHSIAEQMREVGTAVKRGGAVR